MPRVDIIQVPVEAEMGVAVEGMDRMVAPGPPGRTPAVLPEFDPYHRQTYYLDVFNRGQTPFEYKVHTGEPWLLVTPVQGRVDKEQRLQVSMDWARVPTGTHRVPITVTGPKGNRVVQAVVNNPASPRPNQVRGFVESNGYVSMEAEHYSRAVDAGPIRWQRIPDLGKTLSGMTPVPVTAPAQTPGGNSPRLEYRMHLFNSGEVNVRAYVSPTLNFTSSKEGLRYAISIDDEPPQIISIHADGSSNGKTDGNRAWEQSVADNIKTLVSKHQVAWPGEHVLKFWMVDPGIVLQKLVVETGELKPSYLGPPESFNPAVNASR